MYVGVANRSGLTHAYYRYYNSTTNSLDIDGLLQDLRSIPDYSNVLLHVCAHNPTGMIVTYTHIAYIY